MKPTTKADQVSRLAIAEDEVPKGAKGATAVKRKVEKPWCIERKITSDALSFWKQVYRRHGTDWHVWKKYRKEDEANRNFDKIQRERFSSSTWEYRVRYLP
jgi:hypothetical protein